MHVLYEDNHLLAIAKPPGLPTQGALAGRDSLVQQAKEYLRRKYQKPGNVYLGVVSRLDSPTSGVVIFARTSKAAARLNAQFRGGSVKKLYWAIVEGCIEPAKGNLVDRIAKDEQQKRMVVAAASSKLRNMKSAKKSQEARLSYRQIKSLGTNSLLEIQLETGRKHQIRLQLSSRGYPVLGDRKYGSKKSFGGHIALHCRKLVIEHPTKKTAIELVCPVPKSWKLLQG